MTAKQLKEARELESQIWQLESDQTAIEKILEDYNNFGSSITFLRNSDKYSRSFGSKKNRMRDALKVILENMHSDNIKELQELENKFNSI